MINKKNTQNPNVTNKEDFKREKISLKTLDLPEAGP